MHILTIPLYRPSIHSLSIHYLSSHYPFLHYPSLPSTTITGTFVIVTGTFGYRDHTVHDLQTNHDIILNLLVTEVISSSEKERFFAAKTSSSDSNNDVQIGAEEIPSLRKPLQTELQIR